METGLSNDERLELLSLTRRLLSLAREFAQEDDLRNVHRILTLARRNGREDRDAFHLSYAIRDIATAILAQEEIHLGRTGVLAILLRDCTEDVLSHEEIARTFGQDVREIIEGLARIKQMQERSSAVESENFHEFLLALAHDMRVILIMIADRVDLMRRLRKCDDDQARRKVAMESSYLYAPLAHRLGLYRLKSELEDLSLKYTEPDVYYQLSHKLQETKRSREKYIADFIGPLERRLSEQGLRFHIKGRTKSIHSIYQKMRKQKCGFENVYDLFAIRIILEAPQDAEKQLCWQAYSIVTDMYQPNPSRLRDWLSVPKSNGYESLHITVLGPAARWVEVQIRTERMDDIAEHGLAAHWRYKGVQDAGADMDRWLSAIRETLENDSGAMESMDHFKADLYKDEVFIFTPKGEVVKLPKGATVLDFAFHIHTKIGCSCIGARIGNRNVPIRQVLKSGDQVEILTSALQEPRQDWIQAVTTSKAKTKIRQAIKDAVQKQVQLAREQIARKLKNRKIEYDDAVMMRLIKWMGYKINSDFYQDVANGILDSSDVVDKYLEQVARETSRQDDPQAKGAESFLIRKDVETAGNDVLVIDQNLKGIQYQLAKCCHPIYGDPIFGFVSVNGGIKIHRMNCPNAPSMRERFGYRIVRARWSGKTEGNRFPITLMVVGQDDVGIVTNITSIINKEEGTLLRGIGIEANDGLFSGTLTIMVSDTSHLEALIKKIRGVKGVKNVTRT